MLKEAQGEEAVGRHEKGACRKWIVSWSMPSSNERRPLRPGLLPFSTCFI
jgi:hypothetical protein